MEEEYRCGERAVPPTAPSPRLSVKRGRYHQFSSSFPPVLNETPLNFVPQISSLTYLGYKNRFTHNFLSA